MMECMSSCQAKPTSISQRSSDGHDTSAPGNLAFNQVELRRIDKKQAEVKEKKDGAVVATVRENFRVMGTS